MRSSSTLYINIGLSISVLTISPSLNVSTLSSAVFMIMTSPFQLSMSEYWTAFVSATLLPSPAIRFASFVCLAFSVNIQALCCERLTFPTGNACSRKASILADGKALLLVANSRILGTVDLHFL